MSKDTRRKAEYIEQLELGIKSLSRVIENNKPSEGVVKYNSIGEFFDRTGWVNNGFNRDTPCGLRDLEISKNLGDLIFQDVTFRGKNKSECEQKLLRWANDE